MECFGVNATESIDVRVHVAHQFCDDDEEENCEMSHPILAQPLKFRLQFFVEWSLP